MIHNNKTIICRNILQESKHCSHGNKCVFAHSLNEQYIVPNRKLAYDIIKKNDAENIVIDNDLYRVFLQMTRVCKQCVIGKCSGGFNCKYGVISEKYQVCYDDLVNNNCPNSNCNKIHLTKKIIRRNAHHTEVKIPEIEDSESDEESEEEIKKIIAYLNDDEITRHDESIFD